jgi:3-oxoadipate enol-lactonase
MIPHHTATGPHDAPVLVLANSLGTSLGMWDAQVGPLSEVFRVVRFDMRGHGLSDVPPAPYAIDDLGRDVLELLDHLDVGRAHVAGVSLGGMVAIWLGIHAPDRVDRLGLICTSARMGPPDLWRARAHTVRKSGTAALADGTMERWFTPAYREGHDVSRLRDMIASTPDEGYAGCCAVIEHMDQTAGLSSITAPTLVLGGAQDPATPPEEHAAVLAERIPGARLEILDPGAHLLNVERPEDVTRLLLDHLGG